MSETTFKTFGVNSPSHLADAGYDTHFIAAGATTAGERGAALARLKAKLDEAGQKDPPAEDEVHGPGPMVDPSVHRLVPALWPGTAIRGSGGRRS